MPVQPSPEEKRIERERREAVDRKTNQGQRKTTEKGKKIEEELDRLDEIVDEALKDSPTPEAPEK